MIILGSHYSFLDFEIEQLQKSRAIDSINFIQQSQDPKETIETLENALKNSKSKHIILNLPRPASKELISYLTQLELRDVKFLTLETAMEIFLNKCYIPEDSQDLRFLESIHHLNSFELFQKKIIDVLGALTILVFSLPLMFFVRKKIKKESPGKTFFRQTRVGLDGKTFTCIKFRSMHENSHHDPYTREKDNRIFSFGEFMRKTRIDEIPQIFNVLKGEMSLIGPRAEWDILVKEYQEKIPYYHERHLVKPGITGWAQVNFPYGKGVEDSTQKLMYDLYYIKNWSLLLEIKIIFKTIKVVLTKRGT